MGPARSVPLMRKDATYPWRRMLDLDLNQQSARPTGGEGCSSGTMHAMIKQYILISLAAMLFAAASAAGDSRTRDVMQDVAGSLEVLLPLSMDSDAFLAADNRDTVLEHLSRLEESADALADHGGARSLDFRLLAAAFARAAKRIRENFEYFHPAEARYILMDLTQNCIACHSREEAQRELSLSSSLEQYLEQGPISEEERARLQVALRQFDGAMETWEDKFSKPDVEVVDMALDGDFVEYLTVAVRVRKEYQRAARQLASLKARDGTPFYLRRRLQTWIDDLERLGAASSEASDDRPPEMSEIRETFHRRDTRPGLLWDDANLVSNLALSASLRKLATSSNADISPGQLAEAYYMLGVLEARTIGLYSSMPTMEYFWEAAIRTAPGSPHAVNAYALLEEYTVTGISGELPFEKTDETFARLAELRALIGIE